MERLGHGHEPDGGRVGTGGTATRLERRSLPGSAAAGLLPAPTLAQGAYPDRPIRFIVPLPARRRHRHLGAHRRRAFALMLAKEARLRMTHVAYRGETPMLQDMLAGQIHGGFHGRLLAIGAFPSYQEPPTFPAQIERNLREWTETAREAEPFRR